MLSPLFNLYIGYLFIQVIDIDIANYADNTAYVSDDEIGTVVAPTERSARLTFNWFNEYQMKEN